MFLIIKHCNSFSLFFNSEFPHLIKQAKSVPDDHRVECMSVQVTEHMASFMMLSSSFICFMIQNQSEIHFCCLPFLWAEISKFSLSHSQAQPLTKKIVFHSFFAWLFLKSVAVNDFKSHFCLQGWIVPWKVVPLILVPTEEKVVMIIFAQVEFVDTQKSMH